MDHRKIHLSVEQKHAVARLASKAGIKWEDVLNRALDLSRIDPAPPYADATAIIGLFADEPDLIDEVVAYAYRMREQAPLRAEPDA